MLTRIIMMLKEIDVSEAAYLSKTVLELQGAEDVQKWTRVVSF